MATLRTEQEKREIVARCIELEKSGGDVLAYLREQHYISPRATWINLQKEYLYRKPGEVKKLPAGGGEKVGRIPKITEEQKLKAAEIQIIGGQPCNYLRSIGCKNPSGSWHLIKKWLEKNKPDVYMEVMKVISDTRTGTKKVDKGMPKEPEEKELDGVTYEKLELDAGKNYEISVAEEADQTEEPEEPKITKPVNYDGFTVRAVEGQYGSYRYQDINGKQWIDYDDMNYQNDLSMTVDQWRGFIEELKQAARVLGVEL